MRFVRLTHLKRHTRAHVDKSYKNAPDYLFTIRCQTKSEWQAERRGEVGGGWEVGTGSGLNQQRTMARFRWRRAAVGLERRDEKREQEGGGKRETNKSSLVKAKEWKGR